MKGNRMRRGIARALAAIWIASALCMQVGAVTSGGGTEAAAALPSGKGSMTIRDYTGRGMEKLYLEGVPHTVTCYQADGDTILTFSVSSPQVRGRVETFVLEAGAYRSVEERSFGDGENWPQLRARALLGEADLCAVSLTADAPVGGQGETVRLYFRLAPGEKPSGEPGEEPSGQIPEEPAEPSDPPRFSDVAEDAYYAKAVNWALERGITSGTTPTTFSPGATCTTGQILTFLWRANGSPVPTVENPFTDVDRDSYCAQAALWAYEKGLVSGAVFGADRPCTRSAVVTYLWKLAGQPDAGELPEETPWNLQLVNAWNPLPEDFAVSLTPIGENYQVDSRCAGALHQMLEDCRAAGLSPAVCSAYRTEETQARLYANKVDRLMAQGMSEDKARTEAARSVAVPGTSEHQLGLAVDLVDNHNWSLDESQASMPAQQWLIKHSWEYGFILRYPGDKGELTGIIYEPWHYRYVGKEAARVIHQQGLCLEEYLARWAEYQKALAWAMEEGITTAQSSEEFAPDRSCTRAEIVAFLYRALV